MFLKKVVWISIILFFIVGCNNSNNHKTNPENNIYTNSDFGSNNSSIIEENSFDNTDENDPNIINLKSKQPSNTNFTNNKDSNYKTSKLVTNNSNKLNKDIRICIIGAGPAGITAAHELKKNGYENITVFEKNDYIGGRCFTTKKYKNDMGAVYFSTTFKNKVLDVSKNFNIQKEDIDNVEYYSLAKGKAVKTWNGLSFLGNMRANFQALDYLKHHYIKWPELKNPYLYKVDPELSQSWNELTSKKHWNDFKMRIALFTTGFGYVSEAPALYNTYYIGQNVIEGGIKEKFSFKDYKPGFWGGGTQQIWRKLAKNDNIDVKLNVNIENIKRDKQIEVRLKNNDKIFNFDKIIIACNPKDILYALDATKKEKELFNQIRTVDYRTYEIEINNFMEGKVDAGIMHENLYQDKRDRPTIFVKQHCDENIMVAYVNASGKVSDEVIKNNIKDDVQKVGGEVKQIITTKHWKYFPHVNCESLMNGFYKQMDKLQGEKNTLLVGSYLTFDTMYYTMAQTESVIAKFINNEYL